MPWDNARPGSDPKYASREHRDYCTALKRQLKRDGYLVCVETECLFDSRLIVNPNGRDADGLTAAHNADGVTYRGPAHRQCNVREAAVRARARQDVTALDW